MGTYSFKVGPITWSVEDGPESLNYRGGLMKGSVQKSAITGIGVADMSGQFSQVVSEDQQMMDGMGKLMGIGAIGQLLIAHGLAPGKPKLNYLNVDLSNPDCRALIESLRKEQGSRFIGIGPILAVKKNLGFSNSGTTVAAIAIVLVITAAVIGAGLYFGR